MQKPLKFTTETSSNYMSLLSNLVFVSSINYNSNSRNIIVLAITYGEKGKICQKSRLLIESWHELVVEDEETRCGRSRVKQELCRDERNRCHDRSQDFIYLFTNQMN